jgi:hypothetical protein
MCTHREHRLYLMRTAAKSVKTNVLESVGNDPPPPFVVCGGYKRSSEMLALYLSQRDCTSSQRPRRNNPKLSLSIYQLMEAGGAAEEQVPLCTLYMQTILPLK